jgi:hypothetical protein
MLAPGSAEFATPSPEGTAWAAHADVANSTTNAGTIDR